MRYNLHELKASVNVEGSKLPDAPARRAGHGSNKTKAASFSKTIEEAKLVAFVEGTKAVGCSGLEGADITC